MVLASLLQHKYLLMASKINANLNAVADDAIKQFTVGETFVDFRHVLVDPANRDGVPIADRDVHDLILKINNIGFSKRKVKSAVLVDVLESRLPHILKHNEGMTQNNPRLAGVNKKDPVLYTALAGNHFIMASRCFLAGTQTTQEVRDSGLCDDTGNAVCVVCALQSAPKSFGGVLKSFRGVLS